MAKRGPIDLSIVNRSTANTHWVTANGVITPDSLTDVMEQTSDNASALNSLPTPLARFFVAREAFRRVSEARNTNVANTQKKAKAGFAYEQLVSDCLDLYELLFNLKYHRNIWQGSEDIEIREWDSKVELNNLSHSMPKLYNALNDYYNTDLAESVLYFIIYKNGRQEFLLGCSSPFTGWVTPPDLDKLIVGKNRETKFSAEHYKSVHIKRKSEGYYFDGKRLFEDRDEEFQNFMYNYLFGSGNIDNRLAQISSYVKSFQYDGKINSGLSLNIADNLSNNNNPIIINGLNMGQNNEIDVNSFFYSHLIRLPYRLEADRFTGIKYERDTKERNFDYLIPLNEHGLSLLSDGAECTCQIRNYDVLVKLSYKGKEYTKTYEDNPSDQTKGKIKYLDKDKQYVNVGIFPNILSPIEKENNYFKILLVEQDSNTEFTTLNIDKCALSFLKKDNEGHYFVIEEINRSGNALKGVYPAETRSRQSTNSPSGTKYYEMYNTSFDAIKLSIDGAEGVVIVNWRKAQQTNDSYTYAIDLGTSNTFISRTKNGQNEAPVQLDMTETMTSYLHEYRKDGQYPEAYYVENAMPEGIRDSVVTEFAPPLIDGKIYDFPIRTALCRVKGTSSEAFLFDNTNIAFFYEKALQSTLQEILTDIKWEENKSRLSVFVQELMLIIKADILQRDGVLSQTKLVRFRPLSLDGNIKKLNDDIWKTIPEQVFGVKPQSIECYTESEAPYYYFKKRNIVNNTDSVTIIDIGGGSTDFVYFEANKPLIASSVHFGCDELWGEGHIDFENVRENGIFQKYSQAILFKDKKLASINSSMIVDSKVSAKNIINFWLTNQKHCDINEKLRKDYAPLFVYHFTALIYYIASLYKFKGLNTPRTIVFSGNGSQYIDNYITDDKEITQSIIKLIFDKVYGVECPPIYVTLPNDRKESTCYGGLYKDPTIGNVPEFVYHGNDKEYGTAKQLIEDNTLMPKLLEKYKEMNNIYLSILTFLKKNGIIDRSHNIQPFTDIINDNFENNLSTHFRSEVEEKYQAADDVCNDSVFFIPIIDKIFELTRVI